MRKCFSLCLLQSPSIKILTLIVHVGNTALVHPTHLEELLNADEPVDEGQEGGEEAGGEEDDGHGHDELLLVHLPDQLLLGEHRNLLRYLRHISCLDVIELKNEVDDKGKDKLIINITSA